MTDTVQMQFDRMVVENSAKQLEEAFTMNELLDVMLTARERGVSVYELVHDAVMDDLYR